MNCEKCNAEHTPDYECLFPINVERCTNCERLVFDNVHSCGTIEAIGGYFMNVMCKQAEKIFKIRLKNEFQPDGGDLFVYEKGHFIALTSKIFSPSISGVCVPKSNKEFNILTFESSRDVQFTIYFAILMLKNKRVEINLRIDVRPNEIKIMKCSFSLGENLDDQYKMSTAYIFGIHPNSKSIELQLQCTGKMETALWTGFGWDIKNNKLIKKSNDSVSERTRCMNCNNNHCTQNCNLPYYTMHCSNCLVISTDGSAHRNPCMPINKISAIRRNILAIAPYTLFEMTFSQDSGEMLFMGDDFKFHQFTRKTNLISSPAESLITFNQRDDSQNCITIKQNTYKRCCIFVAVLDKQNVYRIRFRFVLTPQHALLVFKQQKTLNFRNGKVIVPKEFGENMLALFAIKPNDLSFYSALKVFATYDGNIDSNCFNGYTGFIGIDLSDSLSRVSVDNCIDGIISQNEIKKFDKRLFEFDDPKPLATFKEQRSEAAQQPDDMNAADDDDGDWTSDDDENENPFDESVNSQITFSEVTMDNLMYANFMVADLMPNRIKDVAHSSIQKYYTESIPTIPPKPIITPKIRDVRASLPITKYKDMILQSINQYRVVVISGATGKIFLLLNSLHCSK